MPPRTSKPPKKGSKKDIDSKANGKESAPTTVFEKLSVDDDVPIVDHDDEGRVATGLLSSEPRARDIKISAFSLALHGIVLVEDTVIELNQKSRYGLLGRNGIYCLVIMILKHNSTQDAGKVHFLNA